MPNWDYQSLTVKARNDALGQGHLNRLAGNSDALVRCFRAEHRADGNHNAMEVARVVGAIDNAGTITTCQGNRVTLATGYNPAVGTWIGTYASGWGLGENVAVMTNIRDSAAASKPHVVGFDSASGTCTWYVKRLDSALGAGNTWGANDVDFDFLIHAQPVVNQSSNHLPAGPFAIGQALAVEADNWNALVEYSTRLNTGVTLEHNTDGTHNTPLVASKWAHITYSPTTYTIADSTGGVKSVSRTSAGIVRVEWDVPAPGDTANQHCFTQSLGGTRTISHAIPFSTQYVDVYLYQYDGTNWARADESFFIVMHDGS